LKAGLKIIKHLNKNVTLDISQLLSIFVAQSNDGYVILDATDTVLYANQYYAETLINTSPGNIEGKTFSEYIKQAYLDKRGPKIETDNIDAWLQAANSKRWQEKFRSFEIELTDGRWFLVTEQVIGSRFLFVHATEVTRTKELELELRRTQAKLLEHAYIDELTNIPNRRKFIERTTEEIHKAQRNQSRIILFLFDIDHFKQINDDFGHQAGDTVLTLLCQLVESQLRDYDIFARVGGEEFAILFTDGAEQDNLATIERIRHLIEEAEFQFNHLTIHCTASFGGTISTIDDKLESLVSRADNNLYRAKRQGRNQTVFEGS